MEIWVLSAREVLPNVIVCKHLVPEKVTIFATEWKVSRYMAENQKKIFERCGIETSIKYIETYDSEEIRKVLDELVSSEGVNPESVVLLANAATKYTVEVIHTWLKEAGGKSYYYIPDGRVFEFGGKYLFEIKENILEAEDFINLAGFELIRYTDFDSYMERDQKERLLQLYTSLIREKIFCASQSQNKKTRRKLEKRKREEKDILKDAFESFYRSGNKNKDFTNDGTPLEFLTFELLRKTELFSEVLANIEIQSKEGLKNEIDVVAVKDNTLFYFSCKKRKNLKDEHLHRVASLSRRLGGLYAVPVLVSCFHTENFVKRALSLGVNVVTPEQLLSKLQKKPEETIDNWRKKARKF
jgi:hypothetical protein